MCLFLSHWVWKDAARGFALLLDHGTQYLSTTSQTSSLSGASHRARLRRGARDRRVALRRGRGYRATTCSQGAAVRGSWPAAQLRVIARRPRDSWENAFSERKCIVSKEQVVQIEYEAAFDLLMRRYGDRLTSEMVDGLRGSVEAVVKTVAAVRSVKLDNGDAPLFGFTPVRKER